MSDFAQTVKQQADIVKVIEGYIRLRKAGAQNYSGLCPFHKEKSPSFSVHAVRQFYHCFGCQASGDVFSFVGKIENVSFPEAVRIVAQKCGIPLPKKEFSSPEQAAESRQRTKLLELHEAATAFFEDQLRGPEGAVARQYLAGRGLTPEGIKAFRIGWAPDSFNALRDRLSGMADNETLRASGLFSSKEQGDGTMGPIYDRFRKRVMFPISNESSRVIAFTGRTLETGEKAGPKYFNSPETPLYSKSLVLFNLDKARTAIRQKDIDFALLVEGQMDCISVYLSGIRNVIATSGTAFTEQQVALLRRHTSNVLVNFDPDTAGANAAEKSIALLTEEGFTIKIVTLDGGLDPDRFIRERGVEAYVAAVRSARNQSDYLIERARQMFPGASSEQKLKAMNFLLPHIRRMPEKLARDQFAGDAAQKLGIESSVLREELRQAALKRRDHIETRAAIGVLPFERFFVEACCNDSTETREYEKLHIELRDFDQTMREQAADWQDRVLPNLPKGLFEQLISRTQGQDLESSAITEEQKQFLRKLFLEESAYPRSHKQDMEIVADLKIQALKWEIMIEREVVDLSRRDGDTDLTIRASQKILELEIRLRELEREG
ncbi:MAG TPA: DNA primase [Terracidiphilus sp.]